MKIRDEIILTREEIEFAKAFLEETTPEDILKDYLDIEDFIKNNLNKQRINNSTTEENIFLFDALYHFRSIHMMKTFLLKNFGELSPTVMGERESLMFSSMSTNISFNERIKNIEVDDFLFPFFDKTKNEIYSRHLPFNGMFFNRIMEIEEGIFCWGIGSFYAEKEGKIFNTFIFSGYDFNDGTEWREHVSVGEEGIMGHSDIELFKKIKMKKVREKLLLIFYNMIDFLNHPEVEKKVIKRDNNKNRIRRGKFPIPDQLKIIINGKLSKYIYEDYPVTKMNSPSYSFEVRGHYYHYRNKKRWSKIYSLTPDKLKDKGYQIERTGLVSRWILPFIKGKGILKQKKYKLEKY